MLIGYQLSNKLPVLSQKSQNVKKESLERCPAD
jgi:hypothetical protein